MITLLLAGRKKVRSGETVPQAATAPNHVWTYDLMFDATFGARRMKALSILDEFSRDALAIVPARSLTASTVKSVLARLFADRGRHAVEHRSRSAGPGSLAGRVQQRAFAHLSGLSDPGKIRCLLECSLESFARIATSRWP